MKILVTGASGFIGRQIVTQLSARGHAEVIAASRKPLASMAGVRPVAIDLLAPGAGADLIANERPSHFIHLAWDATPGRFWSSQANLDWIAVSLQMQRAFQECGGQRLVVAGTCAEYDWSTGGILTEEVTPLNPSTLYGVSKNALRVVSSRAAADSGLSMAWARVFWLYGPNEPLGRLASDVSTALINGRPANCSEGLQARDFLHVSDVAGAFIAALCSDWCGAFNIGSQKGTTIREVVNTLAELSGRKDLLRFGARATNPSEPATLIADTHLLRSAIGYHPQTSLVDGLKNTLEFWRNVRD